MASEISVAVSEQLRQFVADRANQCCEYCQGQLKYSLQPFVVEHITPRSKSGDNDPENLALACQGCNGNKYVKESGADPLTGKIVPLFHPRQMKWEDHFLWSTDYRIV